MATLPADRTKLALAQNNQVPNMVIASAKNINSIVEAYDTIDLLNQKVDTNYGTGAIGTNQLAVNSVTLTQMADSSVGTAELVAASVTLAKMAAASVGTSQLVDGSVTDAKIASGTITADKFVAGALNNDTQNGLLITALQADVTQRAINVKSMPAPYASAVGDGVADDTAAITAARNYIASFANPPKLIFPEGIYLYSVSPNWAIQNAQILNDGVVRFRYTGTGHAVILDGIIGTNSNVYNMKFGQFIIEAPSTALNGVYMKCVHHSDIDVKVRGCGSASAGMFLYFGVCNKIKLTVSTNEEGWYLTARPYYGLRFGLLISGQQPAYNIFEHCIIEGTTEGANLADSLGNIFIGGTMEGCLDNGVTLTSTAGLNKFFGMDFESNAGNDIVCAGFENEFNGCDSTKIADFQAAAVRNTIRGGSYKSITFESGSSYNLVDGAKYNRQLFDGTTGTITDNGTYNRLVNTMDVKNNKIGNRPAAVTSITMTGSVFVYTNQTGNDERIFLNGGTLTSLSITHGSGGDSLATTTPQWVTLSPGDTLSIGYSVAPTVKRYTS